MAEFRYRLEKGSKKGYCPGCNKKSFVRYMDLNTGEYLPDQYGRCDREVKCGFHLNPYKDGYSRMILEVEQGKVNGNFNKLVKPLQKPNYVPKPASHIPFDILASTRKDYGQNTFIQNLLKQEPFPFDATDVQKVIGLYHLGTNSDYLPGMITFPYIDKDYNIRAIQVKRFDKKNHTTKTNFLHTILKFQHEKRNEPLPEWLQEYSQNEKIVSCLFGEHLLNEYPRNPVALVEAPKTAIIATLSCGFPDENPDNYVWLGVYNLSSLTVEKCRVLQGRKVHLFPDLKAFSEWNRREKDLSANIEAEFIVSDWLEKVATDKEKEEGLDLADYLVQHGYRCFRS